MTGFGMAYQKREGYPDLKYIDMYYPGGIESFINHLWDLLKAAAPLISTGNYTNETSSKVLNEMKTLGIEIK